jgi:hypothetical protein
MRDHVGGAYSEARRRERDAILPDGTTQAGRTPAHWRRVALIVARTTGKRVGLDTATRMRDPRDRPRGPPRHLPDSTISASAVPGVRARLPGYADHRSY